MSDQEICEKLRKWIPFAAPGLDTLLEIAAQRLESIQRERQEPDPLTVNQLIAMDGKMLYLVDDFPHHYTGWVVLRVRASENPKVEAGFRTFEIWNDKIPREQIGDTKHGIVSCIKLYATEPEGDDTP